MGRQTLKQQALQHGAHPGCVDGGRTTSCDQCRTIVDELIEAARIRARRLELIARSRRSTIRVGGGAVPDQRLALAHQERRAVSATAPGASDAQMAGGPRPG